MKEINSIQTESSKPVFKFLSYNENVKRIQIELEKNKEDWKAVWKFESCGGILQPPGFLPLVMAVVESENDDPKNTELLRQTPMFEKFPSVLQWLKGKGINEISRCAFFRLPPGGSVGMHVDDGTYYLTKDRYHLAIQGEYLYTVGNEKHLIKPGTFFWFDNKIIHGSTNVSNVDRITFVFDTPYTHGKEHFWESYARKNKRKR